MSFTSGTFIVFVLTALVVYYLVPQRFRWVVLLLASYGFYFTGGAGAMGYLLFITLTTYLAGRVLGALNEKRKGLPATDKAGLERVKRRKKQVVLVTLLGNFGLLYAVKYLGVTFDLLGLPRPGLVLVLPLGLSFYMFQSVGYVIDCYRGKFPPEKNLAKFALFVSFFPQVVQGPISRFGDLAPQLTKGNEFDADQVKYGTQLAMWGYFKKLVISDRAGVVAATVFGGFTQYRGTVLFAGVLFYCIQLYCDFSGGIDITRGVAQMFGIDVAENFCRPLFAVSLTDYWRRWHITLGQWMRDYVFYPMSLSRPLTQLGKWTRRHIKGKLGKIVPTSIATFTVYFLIGIWHGAELRYILFGFWNGILITASLLLEGKFQYWRKRLHIRTESLLWRLFQMIRTSALVFLGRYLTRADSVRTALWMIKMTVLDPEIAALWDGRMLALGLNGWELMIVFLGMAVLLTAECYQEFGGHVRKALEQRHWLVQWAAIFIPLAVIFVLGVMGGDYIAPGFIYQQY
ncbi:MAG: MBOAT family protein [Oscillospiraceae bacterium]|nr:MBOAT family protein [Oscillospiraceae bacterium]